jgi:hypothetical protein
MTGDAVTGIARVAAGGLFEGPEETARSETAVRLYRSESITGGLLEDLTSEGTARAMVSMDDMGRVVARGQQLGTIDNAGIFRLQRTPTVPIRIERGAIIEAGREVGRASVIVLDELTGVRSTPLTTSRVVTTLRRGTVAEVIRVQEGWYEVRTGQASSGWVPASGLAVQLSTIAMDQNGGKHQIMVAFIPHALVNDTRRSIHQVVDDIDRILGGKK